MARANGPLLTWLLTMGSERYWREHGGQGLPPDACGMNTVVDDEVIGRNPCQVKDAGPSLDLGR